jgi:spermidine/putrescine transport system ATP-binding protein
MQKELGITFIYVTHDQEEALAVSDIVVVMNNGVIQQIDDPVNIYNEPKNAFVADFIGESNIVDGIMESDYAVAFSGARFECLDKGYAPDEAVDVVIRPEDIRLSAAGSGQLSGTVRNTTFMGVHYMMLVESGNDGFTWRVKSTAAHPVGGEVGITIGPDAIHTMRKAAE